MPNILIIDDDDLMCATLTRLVKRMDHAAVSASSCAEGLATATAGVFDVVFLDVRLPDGNGLDLLPKIEATPSAPEVIIMTGFGDPNGAELAIKSGAWDYIEKSSSTKEITLSLERALQYRQEKTAVSENRKISALKRDRIIGNSPQLNACLDLVAQAAGSDINVFITGETGTGKELFARAVHENSHRARGNFIVVDCTALPETLVESLLFGHEKGSFTGAEKAREGLVRQAHGGTLFLDEVGELPLTLQKSFLRVLQERCVRPLGSTREIESDFRLVAATNRDLDKMVREGLFREDLLYRLRSYLIELPPLRQRVEDIGILTRFHVDQFCERYSLAPKGFSPEFLEMLKAYSWPGNVREFVHTLERALSSARFDPTLFPKHLPTHLRVQVTRAAVEQEPADTMTNGKASGQSLPNLHDYRESVYNEAEKQYLQDLLSLSEQKISKACRISGLSQSRLYALLKKHDISRLQ
ncbi:MAG: sigma-54-dependent Fis family transcriptional regulator [Desulfuromonadales bacterium]|jgi:two-component system NtrC family response regulator|nr:sigma-54-dependent Fis family transcriptional regulator [Desulfuromonadales bacterium]